MPEVLTIGEVAQRAGVATSALRYYDEIGLLDPVTRVSGQRRYTDAAVEVVGIIRFFREVGFTLSEIRALMESRSRSPDAWRALAARKLEELRTRVAKEEAARIAIDHALASPSDDLHECPTFRAVVGDVLGGKGLAEAHPR